MNMSGENRNLLIECRGLCKDFTNRNRRINVLKNIHFSVNRGEIVVITGKTGAGKTTLISLLGGLDSPTSGEIFIEGCRVDHLSSTHWSTMRRSKIGILFQNFNLLPSWTAIENVEAAMMHTPISRSTRHEKAKALLTTFGLEARLEHFPCELSLGQQQLVALARALANEPLLLLADEPTGDVDLEIAKELVTRLTELAKRNGTTLVVATHGNFPCNAADRSFLLENNCITAFDSTAAVT